jgi:hypothetical protein
VASAELYKYFPDLQAVLTAWHERQVSIHLEQLSAAVDPNDPAAARLESALRTYALTQRHSSGSRHGEFAMLLHQGEHIGRAQQQLHDFVTGLIVEGAEAGSFVTMWQPANWPATACTP